MKILVINWQDIKNPSGGGAEVHMHEIFKRVAALGHDVTIFSCCFEGAPVEEMVDGIRIIRQGSRALFNYIVPYYYYKLFKKQRFDVVVDDINKIPFYTPLYVKEPLIGISHHFFGNSIFKEAGAIAGSYVYLSEWLVNFVYKGIPFAVVSQSTLDEFLERGFKRENFIIVPNAINAPQFPFSVNKTPGEFNVAYFGRLKKYKSPDHLLRAFAKARLRIPPAKLWIMGRGDFTEGLKRLAVELGIDDATTFFGFVSEEEKVSLLARAHCMVNTSMKEGWGITNIEANACGTPVISSNVPGLRDSVSEGVSGELYEYGDIDELGERIYQMYIDKSKFETLCRGSISWAKSFSWDKSAELMLFAMEEAVKRKLNPRKQ